MIDYPEIWKSIRVGDTRESVRQKCPDFQTGLHGIEGDYISSPVSKDNPVKWSLQVIYDHNERVVSASLNQWLWISTEGNFRKIPKGDIAGKK